MSLKGCVQIYLYTDTQFIVHRIHALFFLRKHSTNLRLKTNPNTWTVYSIYCLNFLYTTLRKEWQQKRPWSIPFSKQIPKYSIHTLKGKVFFCQKFLFEQLVNSGTLSSFFNIFISILIEFCTIEMVDLLFWISRTNNYLLFLFALFLLLVFHYFICGLSHCLKSCLASLFTNGFTRLESWFV